MGIEKTRLLICESIYWIDMNSAIEETVKIALHVLNSGQHSPLSKQYHMNYQVCYGNLSDLTSLTINNTIFAL